MMPAVLPKKVKKEPPKSADAKEAGGAGTAGPRGPPNSGAGDDEDSSCNRKKEQEDGSFLEVSFLELPSHCLTPAELARKRAFHQQQQRQSQSQQRERGASGGGSAAALSFLETSSLAAGGVDESGLLDANAHASVSASASARASANANVGVTAGASAGTVIPPDGQRGGAMINEFQKSYFVSLEKPMTAALTIDLTETLVAELHELLHNRLAQELQASLEVGGLGWSGGCALVYGLSGCCGSNDRWLRLFDTAWQQTD